jgi:hypothetical protein
MDWTYCTREMDEKSTALLMEDQQEANHLGDMRLEGE